MNGAEHLVLVGDRADLGQRLDLGHRRRQRQRRGRLDVGGDDRVGHRVERVVTDRAQHLRDLGIVGTDVALDEGVVVLEVAQGRGLLAHAGASGCGCESRVCANARGVPLCPFA
jgi:hypothetical protein